MCFPVSCDGQTAAAEAQEEKAKKAKERKKKRKKKQVADVKQLHEDECFRCGIGGELVMCDRKTCPKSYHLKCLSLLKKPYGKYDLIKSPNEKKRACITICNSRNPSYQPNFI